MKVKDTINFKTLREKGPSAIEIEGEEVVQLVSSKKEMLCIVRQEYLLQLESAYHNLLVNQGIRKEEITNIDFDKKIGNSSLKNLMNLAREDEKHFRSPKLLGSVVGMSSLNTPTLEEEVNKLKKKLQTLENNHPEFFKEKKK